MKHAVAAALIFTALSGAVRAEESIKIGVLLPLTGLNAPLGKQALSGMEVARDEINAAGGVKGRQVQLIVEDTESQSQGAMDATHKLIDVDRVPVVLGEISSSRTIAPATYVVSQGSIHIGISSTSPDLRQIGDGFFNMVPTDEVMGRAMVDVAIADTGKKNFGILVMNDAYGVGLSTEMKKAIEAAGGTVASEVRYETGKTDYRVELQRLFGPEPDIILSVSWGEVAKLISRQASEMGFAEKYNPVWYSAYFSDSVTDCIPETCEGRKGLDIVPANQERLDGLQKEITKREGANALATWFTASGYDAVGVVAKAVEEADSTDAAKIKSTLRNAFSTYSGALSKDLTVDEQGIQATAEFGRFTYLSGKIEPYEAKN